MLLISGNGETAGGLPPSAFNFSANQVCRLGTLYRFTRRRNGFVVYEAKVPQEPTVPWIVLSNRTTVGG